MTSSLKNKSPFKLQVTILQLRLFVLAETQLAWCPKFEDHMPGSLAVSCVKMHTKNFSFSSLL